MTEQEAIEILKQTNAFGWLLNDPKIWWKVAEVAAGLGVSDGYIIGLIKKGSFPNSIEHPGAGWRIPRDSVIMYCAQLLRGGQSTAG